MSQSNQAEFLTTEQVAALIGVRQMSVRRWRCEGAGPPYIKFRGNGMVRYRRTDLDEWVESCVRTSTSDPGPAAAAAAR